MGTPIDRVPGGDEETRQRIRELTQEIRDADVAGRAPRPNVQPSVWSGDLGSGLDLVKNLFTRNLLPEPIQQFLHQADEAVGRGVERIFTETPGDILAASRGDVEAKGRLIANEGAFVLNAVDAGIVEPSAALVDLAGDFFEVLPGEVLDGIAGVFQRSAEDWRKDMQGIVSSAENVALASGYTPEEIGRTRLAGQLVGFTAPLVGSLKVASAITGFKGGQVGNMFGGFLVRDMVAGGILGFTMNEEDADFWDRTKHAATEAGYFGAFSMLIGGLPWLKAARYRRTLMREGFSKEEATQLIERQLTAGKATVTEGKERGIFDVLAEEELISQSKRAQQFIREGQEWKALRAAVEDVNPDRSSHVILFGLKHPEKVLPRLKEQLPEAQTLFVKRQGRYHAVVSLRGKGLSGAQRAQFKKEGIFEGMRGTHAGSEIELVRRGKKRGEVVIRDADGQFERTVDMDNVSLFASVRGVGTKGAPDGLYQEFSRWFKEKIERISDASGGFRPREEVIDDIARGVLPEERLRTITPSDDILFPMDAGLTVEGNLGREALIARDPANAIAIRPVSPAQLQLPAETAGRTFFQITRGEGIETIAVEAARTRAGGIRISGIGGESLAQLPRRDAKKIAEEFARAFPEAQSIEFAGMRQPLYRSLESHVAEGSRDLLELAPESLITFEDAARVWMRENNIRGVDAEAFVEHAAHRMRGEMLEALPKAERETLRRIRSQISEARTRAGESLAYEAKLKGFDYRELPDGRVLLRDSASGAEFYLGGPTGAKEALRTGRPARDQARNTMMPTGFGSTGSPHAPERSPAGNFVHADTRGEAIATLHAEQAIPEARWFTNIHDATKRFEERTGFPLFTEFFDDLFKGVGSAKTELSFSAHKIKKAVGKLSQSERYDFVRLWERTLGQDMSRTEIAKVGRELGLSGKQIRAAEDLRVAIGNDDFLLEYYTRVQPAIAEGKQATRVAIYGDDPVPPFMERFFRHTKTGELEAVDRDPLIVALKWRKNEAMERHAGEAWERLASLTGYGRGGTSRGLKIKDLPVDQQGSTVAYLNKMGVEGVTVESAVVPEPLAQWINQQLGRMRGYPQLETGQTAKVFKKILGHLGVEVEEQVLSRLVGDLMSTWYGALLATPKAVTRNIIDQMLYFDYGRYGAKHLGEAMEIALTREGFEAALNDGAIRLTEGGLPIWDALMTDLLTKSAVTGEGVIGRPLAGAIRGLLRGGKVSRGLANKVLTPYTTADDFNRARSYWNARLHARDNIALWKEGKITEKELGRRAMPGASSRVQQKFVEHAKVSPRTGEGYAGRIISDENHFIYSMSTQPEMLQTSWGQFLGMFSSWPIWAKEMYKHRMMNMTFAQRSAFIARNAAVSGAIGLVGFETGHDLWSWIAPLSMVNYSGGPGFDLVEQSRNLAGGSVDRRMRAAQLMVDDLGRMWFPGQTAVRTISDAFAQSDDPAEIAFSIFLGRPPEHNFEPDFARMLDDLDREAKKAKERGEPVEEMIQQIPRWSGFRGDGPIGQSTLPPGFQGRAQPATPPQQGSDQPLIPSTE